MKQHTQKLNHQQIAELLTRSAGQLDSHILSSLSQARINAMQKQRRHERAFSLSAIGHHAYDLMPHSAQQWVATAILLAAVAVGIAGYWQHAQEHQYSRLDIAILTDDLPIEVFVDQ